MLFLRQSEIVMRKRCLLVLFLVFSVAWVFAQPVTITPPSANIQPGESVTLRASGALYYQWSPATGLSTTDGPVTVASPMVTTTYTCSGFALGDESVVNGNFEQGNVGFTSAYEYNSNLFGEGTYYVDNDASLHHENFFGQGHGDNGNFMIVNGATVPQTNVWTEQISVVPNTYYAFSTWVCTLAGQANEVALLQFSINGNQLGEVFSAPPERYIWEQFYELWYSGNATTATITILNQNTVGSGNDFGLDDISFCELVWVGAPECTVYVGSMSASATADDPELCEGESTILHALPVNGSGNYTYSWTPANTLDDPTSQHPVATPSLGTTTYTCQIVDVDWNNSQEVGVTLSVHPNAETHIEGAICFGESYYFFGDELTIADEYEHTLQTQYDCDSIIHLSLTVYPPNDTTIVDPSICVGESYDFHGTLYDQDGQIAYYETVDNHGCLKVEKLVLSVGAYQMPPVQEEYVCYGHDETPYFKWDKNNVVYHADTYDEAIVPDPNGGCDFKYRLNLKFHQEFYSEEPPVVACDMYVWPVTGDTCYTTQQITRTFQHNFGDKICDSTYVLDVNITYSPQPGKIQCPDPGAVVFGVPGSLEDTVAVVTNTEFFSFQYTFYVKESNPECKWDNCHWTISKPSWAIDFDTVPKVSQTDGKYYSECTVYVADRDDEYVVLTAFMENGCDNDSCKIFLKSSFLDIEENSHKAANIDIVPNPNNGQMMLVFNHFEGKVDVKVYDVTGNLIDSFVTNNDMESQAVKYSLNGRKGIYFIVANGVEGTITKKVVIR